jgi:hypothetical protein
VRQYANNPAPVLPPLRCEFIGGGVDAAAFAGSNFEIWEEIQVDVGPRIVTGVTLDTDGAVSVDDAIGVEVAIDWSDFLLQTTSRSSPAFDRMRRHFRKIGMQCVEVMPLG